MNSHYSDVDSTMAAAIAFNNIVNLVQSSNLNFKLQLSPFSANISLKKTLLKDKSGLPSLPHINITGSADVEAAALAAENLELKNDLAQKDKKIRDLLELVEKLESKNENLKNLEDMKNIEIKKADDAKMEVIAELNNKIDNIKLAFKKEKDEIFKDHKSELEEKKKIATELREKLNDLENENLKLKDVLYGCPECGLFSCECCDLENGDDNYIQSHQPSRPTSPTIDARPLTQRSCPSSLSPWTPPPTPPCEGCGGINFGPCPGSLCFGCIPPLKTKPPPESSNSPSRTPPGTPPPSQHRLGTVSMKNEQIIMSSGSNHYN